MQHFVQVLMPCSCKQRAQQTEAFDEWREHIATHQQQLDAQQQQVFPSLFHACTRKYDLTIFAHTQLQQAQQHAQVQQQQLDVQQQQVNLFHWHRPQSQAQNDDFTHNSCSRHSSKRVCSSSALTSNSSR